MVTEVLTQEISSVSFAFYTPDEIKRLAVKKITSPILLDNGNNPIPDGPYDPALGPLDQYTPCATCHEKSSNCSGHFGYIELAMPVYNPLIFDILLKILKCACLYCHRFKYNREKITEICESYMHVKSGILYMCSSPTLEKEGVPSDPATDTAWQHHGATSRQFVAAREIVKSFYTNVGRKCESCTAHVNTISADPSGKLFQHPLSSTHQTANLTKGLKLRVPTMLGSVGELDAMFKEKRFLRPTEVKEHLRMLWENENQLCSLFWGSGGSSMFFLDVIAVTPNKFRPANKVLDMLAEHPQNIAYGRLIRSNMGLATLLKEIDSADDKKSTISLSRQFEMLCQELQTATNMLLDNTKVAKSDGVPGVRQLLEKKTGLFRWNMMGKRVNHTCRSVISPDPYIAVNEIGIPPIFAKHLTYPERVTSWNAQRLRQAVENGPDVHPGALFVEDEQGRKTNLNSLDKYKRAAVAKTLLSTPGSTAAVGDSTQSSRSGGKVVYRHMQDGDILLVNRQPTLHKPGIMAKKARVLQGERTLRMHYANCKTYNADFDGDEMNVHFPQDELGRAEAYQIVNANQQFTAPTSGEPLRGLIQDHIVSAVLMTKKDTFYTKAEYQQLVYSACVTSNRTYTVKAASALEICEREPFFSSVTPAILKPRELWTGKQVITTVLMHVTHGRAPYSFEKAGKVTGEYWGKKSDELMVVVRDNHLLAGVIDKAQFDKLGLVHAFHELYGAEDAGRLLSIFSRLFTFHLQMYGFTCGMDDLLLVPSAEVERDSMLRSSDTVGDKVHASFVGCDVTSSEFNLDDVKNKVEKQLQMRGDAARAQIDTQMSSELNKGVTTNVNNLAIPAGLMKPFPSNCMCLMTVSGAKGGMVNFTQISTLLGQQDLEGKRVPRMISGKTLPCFPPWDTRPRAGGFVADRFLTGLRPQEYYFHCMAGRDGLVDTSVKTAVSGYLQRCLIKNLEGLRINYDFTVRDSDGSLVQFQYGEDGINVSKISCLTEFELLAKNRNLLSQKLGYAQLKRGDVSMCTSYIEHVSEAFERSLESYLRQTPSRKRNDLKIKKTRHVQEFTHLMNLNYFSSLAPPGEPVGVLAGQSVGEPSTQMTLNTFHFAGRGEMNVTLGIPRLREILLSSSKDPNKKDIKTPIMTCPLKSGKTRKDAERIAALLKRISLADVLEKSDISIIQVAKHSGSRTKLYRVTLKFYPLERYPAYLNLTVGEFTEVVRDKFDKVFRQELKNEIKALSKSLKQIEITSAASDVIAADEPMELDAEDGHVKRRRKKHQEFGEQEDDDDEDEGEEDGADAEKRRGQKTDEAVYEDLEDEIAIGAAEPEQLLVEEDITDEEDDKSDEVTNDPEVLDEPQTNYPDAKNEKIRRGNHGESQNKSSNVKTKMRKAQSSASFNEDAAKISSCNLTSNGLEFVLDYYVPQSAPHVFLPAVFDRSLKSVKVRSTPGIAKCSVIDYAGDAERPAIQTDGINFQGLYAFPEDLDLNKLETNSVVHTLNCYGVEAARSTIVREVQNVFKAYGISVSRRHLDLIADFMTFNGDYRQFNRGGMASSPSPFLKMSYETATRFLMDATLYRDTDDLATPSSRLVVGRPPPVGTGCFDLLQRVNPKCEL